VAKKATKKVTKQPALDVVEALRELLANGKGKATKTAVREAVKAVRKAHRVHDHEVKNSDKIAAKQAKILEQIAKYKKQLKSL
jgi:hypothetical protein